MKQPKEESSMTWKCLPKEISRQSWLEACYLEVKSPYQL